MPRSMSVMSAGSGGCGAVARRLHAQVLHISADVYLPISRLTYVNVKGATGLMFRLHDRSEAAMKEEIRKKILTLLDQHRIMTVATLRPDGWPQATTVGYVNEGFALYFVCGLDSQKAANLARDDRVSLTINHDTSDLMAITGLSMAAHAKPVVDRTQAEKVLNMLPLKYPGAILPGPMPTADDVRIYRLTPKVISVLDYSKGFGHADLVAC